MRDTAHHNYAALREAPGRPDMAPKDVPEKGVEVRHLAVLHPQDCNAGLGHVRSDERGERLIGEGNADGQRGGVFLMKACFSWHVRQTRSLGLTDIETLVLS